MTSGTKLKNLKIVKSEMKFSELKKLIELCGDRGVSELQLGDLKIVFGRQTKDSPLTPTVVQTKATEVQTQQIEKEALVEESKNLDEDDLALMQIEDPVRYEQMLIEGELEDDGTESELRQSEQSRIDSSAFTDKPERTQATQH